MKINYTLALFLFISGTALAQSSGMRTLKDRFKGEEDVHCFKLSGFLARMAFTMADDYEYKEAITSLRSIEFITIPQHAFKSQNVTVNGYKKFLQDNKFEQLIDVKDNGEQVSIYLAPEGKKFDRYLIVVDGKTEVVVLELKGHIDTSKLNNTKLSASSL